MMVKNFLLKAMLFASVAFVGVSCSDDDNNSKDSDTETSTYGAYILNSGSMGSNNTTLSYYNIDSATVSSDIFEAKNSGANMGDTGNNMLIYGSKMYIAMTDSKCIYVTDKNGTLENTITRTSNSTNQEPRYLAAYGKYVYATYYDGYVARIDTTNTSAIDAEVAVGSYPEELAISNGKIYVANSGYGSGNTVSVIDISSFSVTGTITVTLNPNRILADGNGNVFVISWGDYSSIPYTLQRINSDNSVDSIGNAYMMALSADKTELYCISSEYDANWNATYSYFTYNITSKAKESSVFINSTAIAKFAYDPYSISVNPYDGNVYIGTSDYSSEGKMYIINPSDGSYVSSFSTGGINPIGAFFLKK